MTLHRIRSKFEQGLSLFHRGEYEKAIAFFMEVVVEEPDNFEALYNLSCCYARIDLSDEAILYLNQAITLNPLCREWACEDKEFASLHDHPLFQQSITGNSSDTGPSTVDPDPHRPTIEEPEPPALQSLPPQTETTDHPEVSQESSMTNPVSPAPQTERRNPPPPRENSGLPPCKQCEGLVNTERRPQYNPMLMLLIVYIGILSMTLLFLSLIGLIGVPITLAGLYLFSRIGDTWVCQNCGASGSDCGQPSTSSIKPNPPRPAVANRSNSKGGKIRK